MRALLILAVSFAACSPPPPRAAQPKPAPTAEAWYGETVTQLTGTTAEAEASLRADPDRAATLITKAQPLIHRLLSVPRPTLAAMQAVSDMDQLYGRMLLGNRHYEWARMLFQKNLTRWTMWSPQTPDTERRLKLARQAIAECERHIGE